MKSIGGYFELELHKGLEYHDSAIRLNTGRSAFEYILCAKKYKKVFLPFYICEVMIEPIIKLNLQYEFYFIDEQLNPIFERELKKDEVFLYVNYFGLKHKTAEHLTERFGVNLIIDNAQAFFACQIKGIDTFYSARKYFGVADGAYLYTNSYIKRNLEQDKSYDRMSHLFKRIDLSAEESFQDFKQNEDILTNKPIMRMSKLTNSILSSIDYKSVKEIRRRNYRFLDNHLSHENLFKFNLSDEIPMVYPFRSKNEELREKLIKNHIYIATYWPNVFKWTNNNMLENTLVKQVVSIPIDQRYNEIQLIEILKILK